MSNINKISVIMPVYNESIYELKDSINSILKQTYKNFEFIIVDDNPSSNNIRHYLLYKRNCDSRIKLLFHSKNLGTIKSANDAIDLSEGKFIARMDADDIATRNRLEDQLRFNLKYNLDLSCCNYIGFKRESNVHECKSSYPKKTQINQKAIKRVMSHLNIAVGPTLFFRKEILRHIGMYRNLLCEDYDLVARILIEGYKVGYFSRSLVYKRLRNNSLSGLNALKEFIIIKAISKYIRTYNFNKVIPLSVINNKINNIRKKDIIKYHKFVINSLEYKRHKSVIRLLRRYFYAISSPLILRRTIFSKLSKVEQTILLR